MPGACTLGLTLHWGNLIQFPALTRMKKQTELSIPPWEPLEALNQNSSARQSLGTRLYDFCPIRLSSSVQHLDHSAMSPLLISINPKGKCTHTPQFHLVALLTLASHSGYFVSSLISPGRCVLALSNNANLSNNVLMGESCPNGIGASIQYALTSSRSKS